MNRTNRRSRYMNIPRAEGDDEQPFVLSADPGDTKCCNYHSFQVINLIAAFLHGVNALVMAIVYFANDKEDRLYGIPSPYAAWIPNNASLPENERVYTIETRTTTVFLSLNWLIFSFHILSFVFQAYASFTDWFPNGICGYRYSDMILQYGRNPLRFIEYAFSASIMLICIGLLCGIREWSELAAIIILNVATQVLGLACEYIVKGWRRNIAHGLAWTCTVAAYSIIIAYYAKAVVANDVAIPSFVYVILILQMILFMSFGVVQLAQLYCNFRYSELAYTVLSLTAKTLLGYMIYSNVLMGQGRVREAIVSDQ